MVASRTVVFKDNCTGRIEAKRASFPACNKPAYK